MHTGVRRPFELLPIFRERVWGRLDLPAFFAHSPVTRPIGEVWYTFSENQTALGKNLRDLLREYPDLLGHAALAREPDLCPLLLKLIFTSEPLSVQVHPDDDYASTHHGCLGKTEAWYVLNVDPPGRVALGLRETLTQEQFEAAVHSGAIETLLDWRDVRPGEIIFVPAGTVHAIGAGLTICEIQQNSDITYRLYDYGRPRELHLKHGLRVSRLDRHEHKAVPQQIGKTRDSLLECDYFHIERLRPKHTMKIAGQPFYSLLICVGGMGTIGMDSFGPGRAWFVPAGSESFVIDGPGSEWIFTYTAKNRIPDVALGPDTKDASETSNR